MPNNIKITELVGEVNKLNESLAETANRIKSIIDAQKEANKEISNIKTLTDTNAKLNTIKKEQSDIEKEGEKLLNERNKLIVAQDERLKELTKSTIKEREAKKNYTDAIKAEDDAYKKLNLQYKESLSNTKRLAAQYGVNSKQAKQAASETNKLGKELDNIRKLTGGAASNNVGKYFKDIVKGGLALTGLSAGFDLLKKGFTELTKNQAFGDKWEKTMGSMTAATSTFFGMVASGNFTNFTGRLKEAIAAGREYADALDDLFEGGLSLKVAEANAQKEIAIQQLIRDNVNLTLDERIAAAEEINRVEDEILAKRITEAGKAYEAYAGYIEGVKGLNREKLISFITNYREEEGLRTHTLKKLERQQKLMSDIEGFKGLTVYTPETINQLAVLQGKLEILNQSFTPEEKIYIDFYKKYGQAADEEITNVIESFARMTEEEAKSLEGRKRNNNKLNTFLKELNTKEEKENKILIDEKIEDESDFFNAISAQQKKELEERKSATEQKKAEEKEFTDFLEQQSEKRDTANIVRIEKELKDHEEFLQKKKELEDAFAEQAWDAANTLGNTLFDLAQNRNDRELEGLRSTYNAKIEAAEGNKELQDKLAKELEAKELEIQQRQAKSERNQALFNLAITTAQKIFEIRATAAAYTAAGLIPLAGVAYSQIPLLLATSALSAGLIMSQPIPGFFMGTEDAPAGLAWVAEHGSELIQMKDGSTYLAKEKQLVNFEGGEKVHTAQETAQLLNSAIYTDIAKNGSSDGIEERLDKMILKMDKMKQLNVNFDKNGMEIFARQGNTATKYLNRKGRK